MEEKISVEEILQLRKKAEAERQRHHEIMCKIKYSGCAISDELQEEIVHRRREDEILAMLEKEPVITKSVQSYIYDEKNGLPQSKDYMLRHTVLDLSIQQKLFDEKVYLYLPEEENKCCSVKFSPAGEKYMVEQTLASCEHCNQITTELTFLNIYIQQYQLSSLGDTALMKFLGVYTGRDSTIDTLQRFVINYIAQYEKLSERAEFELVNSGNHRCIMFYIQRAKKLPSNSAFVTALEKRANKEEVTAFYKRYAKED